MLYISRRMGIGRWGVVDTDDYIETVCDMNRLREAVCCGLEIKGVSVIDRPFLGKHIDHVEVYQNPEFSQRNQAKMAVLNGVDIRTSGTDIVSISTPSGIRGDRVSVRLSDFGDSCSPHILGSILIPYGKTLTLVLDDKLKFTNKTFKGAIEYSRLYLDVTEVTDQKALDRVYLCDGFKDGFDSIETYIIDNEDRLDFYKGVGIIMVGVGSHSSYYDLSKSIRSMDDVSQKLAKRFHKEFYAISDGVYSLRSTVDSYYATYYLGRSSFCCMRDAIKDGVVTYELARRCSDDIIWMMRTISAIKKGALLRLQNYFQWFNPTQEMQDLLVRFCTRATQWIYEVVK